MKRIVFAVAMLIAAVPCFAQEELSEETLRMQSLERMVVAMQRTAQLALERLPIGGVVVQQVAPQQAPQAPVDTANIATACSSAGGFDLYRCGFQLLASPTQGLVDIIKSVGGPLANVHIAKTNARATIETAKVSGAVAIETSKESNATLRTAMSEIGKGNDTPTQVNNINNSQAVSVGGGPITWTWTPVTNSNNPTNPNPLVCTPTYGTTGAINGFSCPSR